MKLGLAMHPEKWNDAHLAMARQLGCETVVAWVPFGAGDGYWHEEDFARIVAQAKKHAHARNRSPYLMIERAGVK